MKLLLNAINSNYKIFKDLFGYEFIISSQKLKT
jgi:hypothetical protein